MPRGAPGAEVPEQPGVQQRGGPGPLLDGAELPGVERQERVPVGRRGPVRGQARDEVGGGHPAAALGPGRVGGEDGRGDGHPVQGEGPAQFG